MKEYRRFEILLPLAFNDGQEIPKDLLATTLTELRSRFGALSVETQTIHGTGSYHATEYDDLVRVFVDVAEGQEARDFFVQFKERLKERFAQWDIWITTYPVEVI
jgi:hypothetical protein